MNRFIIFIITMVFGSSVAMAQGSMPEIFLEPGQTQGFKLDQSAANDLFVVKNPLMRDIIILQNQVNILEGLVERQSEVEDIALNYERIGVPFRQPKPPKSTCAKLPLNILCLFFYPELPINQSIVSESIDRYEERQQQKVDEMIEEMRRDAIENAQLNMKQGKSPVTQQKAEYFWSDIQCKNNQCSALIKNNINQNDILRVKVGDIHTSGLKITSIDPREGAVIALYEGKKVNIKPLPLSQPKVASNNDEFDQNEIVDLLRENLNDPAQYLPPTVSIPQQTIPATVPSLPTEAINNNQEPLPEMLGVTGLF